MDCRLQESTRESSPALMWGRCGIKEVGYDGYYSTVGLNLSLRHEQPMQPCQPPTVCLFGFAHKREQHHQLHNLTVMPQRIRGEVTLLLFPPLPLPGRGKTHVSKHHLLSQATWSRRAKAPGQRLASRGGLAWPR